MPPPDPIDPTEPTADEGAEWHEKALAAYAQALQLAADRQPFLDLLRDADRWQLLHYQGMADEVQIIGGWCDVGDELHGRKFTLHAALEALPIPSPDCQADEAHDFFCNCSWKPLPRRGGQAGEAAG